MTYLFFRYDHAGRKCGTVRIEADSDSQARERAEEIITYCDIYACSECPRYGDDCDGKE